MKCIELYKAHETIITIMIFCEGTILKPKSLFSIYNHRAYIPIGNCIKKISGWQEQGAEIIYCTSRKGKQAEGIAELMLQYGIPGTYLYYREKGESYSDIVEKLRPDVLIEDDCKSIGGIWQMCISKVDENIRNQIRSIVVNEFKGIDHLPDDLSSLRENHIR